MIEAEAYVIVREDTEHQQYWSESRGWGALELATFYGQESAKVVASRPDLFGLAGGKAKPVKVSISILE